MAKYRKISPCIWNDSRVRELSDKGKLALLFMLTHPYMTPLGAIRANFPGLAFELGWSAGAFRKAFAEIIAQGIAQSDEKASLIWFPKFLKHNLPESPNVVRSWPVWFEDLPESPLKQAMLETTAKVIENLGEGFKGAFTEAFPQDLAKGMPNQEQEQEQEKERENTASAASPPAAEHALALSPVGGGEEQPPAAVPPPAQPTEPEELVPPSPASPSRPRGKQRQAQPPVPEGESYYRAKAGRCLTGKRLASFERFWDDFDFTKGKAEAADAWLDIPQLTDALVDTICHAARMEAQQRVDDMAKGKSPKWAQGWLNSRRWEDYTPLKPSTQAVAHCTPLPHNPTPEELEANRQRGLRHAQHMRERGILPGGPQRCDFSGSMMPAVTEQVGRQA